VWLSLSVALGAGFMVQVIGGDDFAESIGVLQVQALAVACTFVSVTCGFLLLSLRRHRAILLGNVVPLTFGVALTLVLAPADGADGAAIATVAAEVGLAVAMLALVVRRGVPHVPLSLRVLLPVALAAAAGAAMELVVPGVHDVITVALATVVYFGVLAALGQIPSELRGALRRGRTGG
jgi:O-antigen/teichoic acid export membrane protein